MDQRQFRFPLWDAVQKGTLNEITGMFVPKWNTSSGLVAAHVQGTEPTPGTYTATSEGVTPAAVSGKLEITREVWDQGGSPAATAVIWPKMQQAYIEALEAAVVTELNAESPGGTITLTTAAADAALSDEVATAWADLLYVRGAFDTFVVQIDLFKKLVAAKDTAGRKLFPLISPNAAGQPRRRYPRIDVHGAEAFPGWALAATGSVAANSYLFDPDAVLGLASPPQKLELTSLVKQVELAIWGYQVVEVIDPAGVRRVVYDPV